MMRLACLAATLAVVLSGCGKVHAPREAARSLKMQSFDTATRTTAGNQLKDELKVTLVDNSESLAATPVARQIIYKANVSLVVDSLSGMNDDIRKVVEKHQGYVSSYGEQRSYGDQRTASWVVRVPAAGFDAVLDHISGLGVPESTNVDSEDVSEEFVDLDARLANKRRLETELLTLLDERDGELKDVIAVKQELSSVREEIERMEGRLRYLRDQVSLTTISITAREDRNYKPQQAPTFAARIGGTWDSSLLAMREAGENLVIAVVALAPWAAVACVVIVPLFMWVRRMLRTAHSR